MASFGLDAYVHKNRLLSLHPAPKIVFSFLSLLVVISSRNAVVPFLVFLLASYLTVVWAGIPARVYFRWLLLPVLFLLPVFLVMVFFVGGGVGTQLFGFNVSSAGFWMGVLVSSRMLGGVSAMYFLAFTTPIFEVFLTLRRFRVPGVFVEMSLLIYRYIFVLADEAARMNKAQEVRLGYSSKRGQFKSTAMLASSLFERALDRGENVFLAMESRGYSGELKLLNHKRHTPPIPTVLAAAVPALLAVFSYLLEHHKI